MNRLSDQAREMLERLYSKAFVDELAGLTALLVEALGPRVLTDPMELSDLRVLAEDAAFRGRYAAIKRAIKDAQRIKDAGGMVGDRLLLGLCGAPLRRMDCKT